jgi:hypothetical protein
MIIRKIALNSLKKDNTRILLCHGEVESVREIMGESAYN